MQSLAALSATLADNEYRRIQDLMQEQAGIRLGDNKRALVTGRLGRRLRHHGLTCYGDYLELVTSPAGRDELRMMVDLLTTNETYFFREPRHFEFLDTEVLPRFSRSRPPRVWSAACSSGEEAFTLAMLMADHFDYGDWTITATDISQQIIDRASQAWYPADAVAKIPKSHLFKYCLRGVRAQAGVITLHRKLRERVEFSRLNLNGDWPGMERFDVIMLRNVMIYFDAETKARLVRRIVQQLRPGGHLIVGHSESVAGMAGELETLRPSIYRRR